MAKTHEAAVYFDAGPRYGGERAGAGGGGCALQIDGQTALRMGSKEQPILGKRGDDLRIDWGYLYLAADKRGRV